MKFKKALLAFASFFILFIVNAGTTQLTKRDKTFAMSAGEVKVAGEVSATLNFDKESKSISIVEYKEGNKDLTVTFTWNDQGVAVMHQEWASGSEKNFKVTGTYSKDVFTFDPNARVFDDLSKEAEAKRKSGGGSCDVNMGKRTNEIMNEAGYGSTGWQVFGAFTKAFSAKMNFQITDKEFTTTLYMVIRDKEYLIGTVKEY